MIESNIDFCFKDKFTAFKFDETEYYKKYTNGIKEGKGVDFIAFSDKEIVFVEVKNCMGHEKKMNTEYTQEMRIALMSRYLKK